MKTLFKKGIRQFWKDLNGTFLIILVTGIFTSVVLLSRVIVFLLENHEYKIWGFFFGLIIASAFVILKDIKTLNLKNIIIVLFGFAIAAGVVLSNTTNLPNTDLYIFFSGSMKFNPSDQEKSPSAVDFLIASTKENIKSSNSLVC